MAMKYNVFVKSSNKAVVKASYLNKDFQYVFLNINFEPVAGTGVSKKGKGDFTFTSVHLDPPLAFGDPMRHKIIRSEFHKRTDINETVQASSLEEACTMFFTPFQDTFEILEEEQPKAPAAAQKTKQRVKAA